VLLSPSSDQEFFRETTDRFLTEKAPVDELRRLAGDPVGYGEGYWRQGAELGWTSLLVGEEHGGGSISGHGLIDLTLVAGEFGRHAAPGPLVGTNVVAATLSELTADRHADVIAGVLDGSLVTAWAYTDKRPHAGLGDIALTVAVDGDTVVLDGVKRPVESATTASHVLVTGTTGGALTQVLVPLDTPGTTVTPMEGVDLTRRFAEVAFDDVRVPLDAVVGDVGGAAEQVERQLRRALVIGAAEAVGAMQRGFDMTVEYAFDRYSFGRPLASYQALKHRFADMKAWLETSHGLADDAAVAVATDALGAAELVSAAAAYVGGRSTDLLQECVQLLGGIGMTYEHDIHIYLRRATLDRALYGTPAEHRQRLADFVEDQQVEARAPQQGAPHEQAEEQVA
jgi:alkylation response protein AidB-like acyl-CoA dehydrogenase